MKKILGFFIFFLVVAFLSPVNAQMMGGWSGVTVAPQDQAAIQQDETAGKTIWDKLQNKQITCQSLKDDDFDKLGDFFMGSMMGSSHDTMDQMMTQRLGENGEKQMHIAMGKRLSGCDANASFPQGSGYFMPMMGFGGGMMGGNWNNSWGRSGSGMPVLSGVEGMGFGGWNTMMGSSWGIFGVATWIIVVVFLILGSVYFWKGISKSNNK